MLPLLRAQPGGHYITLHIHGRPYLVTPGDEVRLPFLMPGVRPGDVLRLNRASVLGSRDLTLLPSGPGSRNPASGEVAYVDERLYECRAVVAGVDSEPMRTKEKTKRRNRKVKTVKSKHRYTVLRISELRIKAPEELEE
jgi:large subunit ribosomal protein L21